MSQADSGLHSNKLQLLPCHSIKKIYVYLFIYCVCVCVCAYSCTCMPHAKFIKQLVGTGFLHPPLTMWSQGSKSSCEIWWQEPLDIVPPAAWPEPFLSVVMMRNRVEHHTSPITLIPALGCGKSVGYSCTLKLHL